MADWKKERAAGPDNRFCLCGRRAVRYRQGLWVCEPCDAMESVTHKPNRFHITRRTFMVPRTRLDERDLKLCRETIQRWLRQGRIKLRN